VNYVTNLKVGGRLTLTTNDQTVIFEKKHNGKFSEVTRRVVGSDDVFNEPCGIHGYQAADAECDFAVDMEGGKITIMEPTN
jgi:hypothetical protein